MWVVWKKGKLYILLVPKDVLAPMLLGLAVIALKEPHTFVVDDVVAWGKRQNRCFGRVLEVQSRRLRLDTGSAQKPDAEIYRASKFYRPPDGDYIIPVKYGVFQPITGRGAKIIDQTKITDVTEGVPPQVLGRQIIDVSIDEVFAIAEQEVVAATVTNLPEDFIFSGNSKELTSGQWVAGEEENGTWLPLLITSKTEAEDHFALTFQYYAPTTQLIAYYGSTTLKNIFGPFHH